MKKTAFPSCVVSDYNQLQDQMATLLGRRSTHFEFAMVEYQGTGLSPQVSHPDLASPEPVFPGKIRLQVNYWRIAPAAVYSEVLDSPTWKTLLSAIDALLTAHDSDYIFLEDLCVLEKDDSGVLQVELHFGS